MRQNCLVMFTPRVMVFKMSKMSHFMYCLLMITVKNQSQFGQSISSFRICYGLLGFELPLAKCQPFKNIGFWDFFKLFSERTQDHLSGALKYLAQTRTSVLLLSTENMKNKPFLTF